MKKYILYPGHVPSMNDANSHFIDFCTLARLYGLSLRECFNADNWESIRGLDKSKFIQLGPHYKGDYQKHLEEELIKHDH